MTSPLAAPDADASLSVGADQPAEEAQARRLAAQLGLPFRPAGAPPGHDLQLVLTASRLELHSASVDGHVAVCSDFAAERLAWRRRTGGARTDDLARAVGLGPPRPFVLDATAGLGRDAWLLASLGCRLLAVERSPAVWALLDDALRRARESGAMDQATLDRFSIRRADAREVLLAASGEELPDVVLIDPMYPPSGRSALPRKEMRLLSRLIGQDDDASELLAIARSVARRRVVVKRHARDEPLGGERPTHARVGRSTRFDVYVRGGTGAG